MNALNISKVYYLVRFFLIAVSLGGLLFWMGWIMGKDHYKHRIVAALKAGSTHEAIGVCVEWQKNGGLLDPMFFITKAIVHFKNGNDAAGNYTLDKAVELMGK